LTSSDTALTSSLSGGVGSGGGPDGKVIFVVNGAVIGDECPGGGPDGKVIFVNEAVIGDECPGFISSDAVALTSTLSGGVGSLTCFG
jgi:hypothetical protein